MSRCWGGWPKPKGLSTHRLGVWVLLELGGALGPGDSRPEWLLTGWKMGGCRMKGSGSGSSFSPGDMGMERLQLGLQIQIPGALALPPLAGLAFPSQDLRCQGNSLSGQPQRLTQAVSLRPAGSRCPSQQA